MGLTRGVNAEGDEMELLTLEEVSAILGSKDKKGRFVRNLRKSGQLPAIKVGRNLMFFPKDIEQYLARERRRQN